MKRSLSTASFLLLVCASTVIAQPSTTSMSSAAAETGIGQATGAFFALSAADVEALSRWYQEKLGFRVISQGEAPNKIAKFAILEGDGTLIEIIQRSDAKSIATAAPETKNAFQIHGIFKVGMVVKDVDRVYQEVKKRGVAIEYDLSTAKDVGLRSFSIRDSERNMIQFFGK